MSIVAANESMAKENITDAMNMLDDAYPFFYTYVYNMGNAYPVYSIPTMAVGSESDPFDGQYKLLYNPDFVNSLKVHEVAAVLAHESMHIMLTHLPLMSTDSLFPQKKVCNIAMDIIINDYLVRYGFEFPDGVIFGKQFDIHNSWNLTFPEIYYMLCEDFGVDPEGDPANNGMADDGIEDGDISDGGGLINDHSEMQKAADSVTIDDAEDITAEQIENAVKEMNREDNHNEPDDKKQLNDLVDHSASAAGNTPSVTGFSSFDTSVSLSWKKLIRKIDPDAYSPTGGAKHDWSIPSRKIMGYYPNITLPSVRSTSKEKGSMDRQAVVLAVDVSGSIPNEVVEKFFGLTSSIPLDIVDVFACTFDTMHHELDLKNLEMVGGGGTSFCAISEFILDLKKQKKIRRYPDVVVFTDGQADFNGTVENSNGTWKNGNLAPDVSEYGKWNFLLIHETNHVGYNDRTLHRPDDIFIDQLKNYTVGD